MSYQPEPPDDRPERISPGGRPVHPLDREPVPAPPPGEQVEVVPPPGAMQRVTLPATTPFFTYVLIAINVLVFLADSLLAASGAGVQGMGPLTLFGAKSNQAILAGQYWRFITPLFLHGGILHLGFNSYFLYIVGRQIERAYGHSRFLALYFVSGFAATIASFALSRADSIGASGALFGIIGAWLPLLYRNQHVLGNTRRQIRSIVQVIAINLLIGLTPGIDNWAHLGGLVGGVVLGWFSTPLYEVRNRFSETVRIEDDSSPLFVWSTILGVTVILIGIAYLLISLRS